MGYIYTVCDRTGWSSNPCAYQRVVNAGTIAGKLEGWKVNVHIRRWTGEDDDYHRLPCEPPKSTTCNFSDPSWMTCEEHADFETSRSAPSEPNDSPRSRIDRAIEAAVEHEQCKVAKVDCRKRGIWLIWGTPLNLLWHEQYLAKGELVDDAEGLDWERRPSPMVYVPDDRGDQESILSTEEAYRGDPSQIEALLMAWDRQELP